jgi:zinc transport system ATP-binding protein
MVLEVNHLFFSYEKLLILDDINVSIKRGEFVGIFGPNGGGKTTFLKLLLGLLKPDRGSIRIFGKSPEQFRDRIGYVPQFKLFDKQFPISVLEVVLQGCLSKLNWWGHFSKEYIRKAKEALAKMHLEDKADEAFGTLSGGQMQRVLIARSLVSQPDLLLLDESTSSVDAETERSIYKLLLELKGKMTIIMVTHDLSNLVDKADRFLCIQKQMTYFQPKEVCEHFTLGLYHPPLKLPLTKRKE